MFYYRLVMSQAKGTWREEYFISANFFLRSSCSFFRIVMIIPSYTLLPILVFIHVL